MEDIYTFMGLQIKQLMRQAAPVKPQHMITQDKIVYRKYCRKEPRRSGVLWVEL